MKSTFLLLASFLFFQIALGQSFVNNVIFSDDFSSGNSGWTYASITQNSYSAEIINGKYKCYLPENHDWNWTYVGLPNQLSRNFNYPGNVSLEFDVDLSQAADYFQFGLMFDLHNVTQDCPGGDFYEINFSGEKSNSVIESKFYKMTECNSNNYVLRTGRNIELRQNNHFAIKKLNKHWMIYINQNLAMEIDVNGDISLNRLLFGKGTYYFDNFSLSTKSFVVNTNPIPVTEHPTSNNRPKIWAVCAGIEDYSLYPGYPQSVTDLSYTVADARSYYQFLTSSTGGQVPPSQLKLLTNRDATAENILYYANELFQKAGENDLVVIFLSGHGGTGFFCSSNGALEYENLNKILRKSQAKRKLSIVDACHSGSWNANKNIIAPKGQVLSPDQGLELFYNALSKSGEGINFILAAEYNELSVEGPQWHHGAFTYYLLKGLNCGAQSGNSPIITIQDLYDYLSRTVPAAVQSQHPVLKAADATTPISVCVNR